MCCNNLHFNYNLIIVLLTLLYPMYMLGNLQFPNEIILQSTLVLGMAPGCELTVFTIQLSMFGHGGGDWRGAKTIIYIRLCPQCFKIPLLLEGADDQGTTH